MSITLDYGDCGTYLLTDNETRDTILIQTDWDYPGVASTFGWDPCAECSKVCKGLTDGTVECTARTVSDMIEDAENYLDSHIGESVEDPGYFGV